MSAQIQWASAFIRTENQEQVVNTLKFWYQEQGYKLHDPFPGGQSTTHLRWSDRARVFVSPPSEGWIKILALEHGEPMLGLSRTCVCPALLVTLSDSGWSWTLYHQGVESRAHKSLVLLLRVGVTLGDVRAILGGEQLTRGAQKDEHTPPPPLIGGMADVLPDDIRQLAEDRGMGKRRANWMFDRMAGRIFKQVGASKEEQAKARQALQGKDIWGSQWGQKVRAFMDCLAVPADWREPDIVDVREAYTIYRLHKSRPHAKYLPGDQIMLDAVPEVEHYQPVYFIRS